MPVQEFHVAGLSCIDCAGRVEATVRRVDGVEECHVDHATGTLVVSFTTPTLAVEQIAAAVSTAGYTLADDRDGPRAGSAVSGTTTSTAAGRLKSFLQFVATEPETRLTAIAALLLLAGLGMSLGATLGAVWIPAWLPTLAFAGAIAVGGYPIARHAWQETWLAHRLGINTLMVIAVTGAGLIGEWAEAAVVVVLFSLGEALEDFAAEQARSALESLLDLAPPVALKILPSGQTEETPVESLTIGDRVLVRAGDRVSVDGVVLTGESAVDQSPITGESVPVEKRPGDEVFAGTVNTTGTLEVEVTRLAADNTLNRMIALVQEARSRQAPVQRFIDRFARYYTPGVAVVALVMAAAPPLLLGQPFWGEHGWLMRALQMLIIACPCALVISTPVSLVSAMTNGASRGVLIKGGRYLEALSRVRVFAFDKTGTLTEGRPVATDIIDVCTCGECPDGCGLQHAAAVESQSAHPLARAIVEAAQTNHLEIPLAQEVSILAGRGVEGVVNGANVTVASHAYFDEYFPHPEFVCRRADELAAEGKTVVLVRHDDEVCGLFGVADTLRPNSRDALADLKAVGGVRTVMLTGDNRSVAEAIGRQAGVDEVRAELLPEEKVAAVVELAERYGSVAMVGDGVNDAPALAQADVGIAMGGAGSDQAMETADVVLMGDDLTHLPFLLALSRRTKRVVTANIALALGVKAAVFVLAAAGLATLWMAIVADVGASVAVIVNGMRLRR